MNGATGLPAAVRHLVIALAVLVAAAALAVAAAVPSRASMHGSGAESRSGDVDDGKGIFNDSCAMCHGADASGMMGMHPSLRGAVARLSREGVEVTIRRGRETDPPMPAFESRLTSEEIDDVVAFIASLPEGPRNFGPGDDGMMGGDGMMMGDGMDASDVALVVLAVVAVVGLAAGVVVISRTRGSPRRALDRRYAAGELSRDEYLQRRRDLGSD